MVKIIIMLNHSTGINIKTTSNNVSVEIAQLKKLLIVISCILNRALDDK